VGRGQADAAALVGGRDRDGVGALGRAGVADGQRVAGQYGLGAVAAEVHLEIEAGRSVGGGRIGPANRSAPHIK
jgi:hypothetical protein